MYILKAEKERCEINKCGRPAVYTINLNRSGIRSKIHICHECLLKLYAVLGTPLIPKSIETVKKTGEVKRADVG